MARSFMRLSAQRLATTNTPSVVAAPMTMSAWFKSTGDYTTEQAIVAMYRRVTSVSAYYIGVDTSGLAFAKTRVVAVQNASTGASVGSGVWTHVCGVFASATSRTVYVGGVAGTPNVVSHAPSSITGWSVGSVFSSIATAALFADGDIAEAGIWNVALTLSEIQSLAAGFAPIMIRPSALKHYVPVSGYHSPESEVVAPTTTGGLATTNTPPAAAHPAIVRPGRIHAEFPKPVVVATRDIYVANAGVDGTGDGTIGAPYATIGKVNGLTLNAGDRVWFKGGDTFSGTLKARGAGVVIDAYGTGKFGMTGDIWVDPAHSAGGGTVRNFAMSGPNGYINSTGAGVDGMVFEDFTIDQAASATTGVLGMGIGAGDTNWVVRRFTIQNTGDSGMIPNGAGHHIYDGTIHNIGLNTGLGTYGKHGIYQKARDALYERLTIDGGLNGSAFSARFPCEMTDCDLLNHPSGVSVFDENLAAAGVYKIHHNRIAWTANVGVYLVPGGATAGTRYTFAANVLNAAAGAPAIDMADNTCATAIIDFQNNVFKGSGYTLLMAVRNPTGAGVLNMNHNCYETATNGNWFRWEANGNTTFANFVTQSGREVGSLRVADAGLDAGYKPV